LHFERFFTPFSHGPKCIGALFRFVPFFVRPKSFTSWIPTSASPSSITTASGAPQMLRCLIRGDGNGVPRCLISGDGSGVPTFLMMAASTSLLRK